MKKLISLVLVFICLFAVVGCGKDNEFIEVFSVTYTIGSEKTTIESVGYIEYERAEETTDTEFFAAKEEKRVIMNSSILKTDTKKNNLPNLKSGDIFYFQNSLTSSRYYKSTVILIELRFVSIKIVSDKSIEIKTYDEKISLISTDSYKIEYFN